MRDVLVLKFYETHCLQVGQGVPGVEVWLALLFPARISGLAGYLKTVNAYNSY